MIALVRTQFVKAGQRARTLAIALLLVGLPALIVITIHARGNRGTPDNGVSLFDIARQSGLLVPAAILSVMSGFLLVVVAGMFAGDSVAGDAAWGNLRYVLMRPVTRGRLIVAKALVAYALIWISTILVTLAALIVGVIFFGSHSATVGAFHFGDALIVERVAIATAYVAFGFTALLAFGIFFSTLTDSPAGAIGATIGVYIVSEVLDGISQFGQIRYAFPTHYLNAWSSMFTQNQVSQDMLAGILVQLAYLAVVGAVTLIWFGRKDIRS